MTDVADRFLIGGLELRYVLTETLLARGPSSVAELVAALDASGFTVRGRATKAVSDALRWERGRGRIVRLGWGRYGPGSMPAATRSRIRRRVGRLHDRKVAARWQNASCAS